MIELEKKRELNDKTLKKLKMEELFSEILNTKK